MIARRAAVVLLLSAAALQGLWSAHANSPTADEFAHHIANGYSYWKTGDFRMNPASPPLPRMLASAPLLILGAKAPLEHPSWEAGDSPEFARQFFYGVNDRPEAFIFWARVPIILLSIVFGLCIYLWTCRQFGAPAALSALALYVFCPDVLAHASLATADLAVAFFFFCTVVLFARWLDDPLPGRAALTAVLAALAFLSKFSALLLFPCLLGIAVFSKRLRSLRASHLTLAAVVFFLTLWAGYGFEMKPLLKNTPSPEKKAVIYQKIGGEKLLYFAENVPVPLSTFSSALVSMMYTRAQGTNAFLLGKWSTRGWWYYYFLAFLVKSTLAFLALLLIGFFRLKRDAPDRVLWWTLVLPPTLFFLVTLTDKAQAGIRYFLPIYPFFFVVAGLGFARLWSWRKGRLAGLGLLLLAGHVLEVVQVAPYYLTHFNALAGGSKNGYKILRDSNLDWGQGLKALAELTRKNDYGTIVLYYPWPADPASYGIPFRPFAEEEMKTPGAGVYAISAHFLDNVAWAGTLEPTARPANSIFIYDLRKK